VGFSQRSDAEAAIHEMDGAEFQGNQLIVEWTKGLPRGRGGVRMEDRDRGHHDRQHFSNSIRRKIPPERSDFRVVVSNVPEKCHWTELKDKFREAGSVVFGDVWGSRCVVEFKYEEDMQNTTRKFNKHDWKGVTLRVVMYRRKMGSPSRSRSRSRSRHSRRRRSRSRRSRDKDRSLDRDRSRERDRERSKSRRSRSGSKSSRRNKKRSRSGSRSGRHHRKGRSNSRSRSRRKRSRKDKNDASLSPPKNSDENKDNNVDGNGSDQVHGNSKSENEEGKLNVAEEGEERENLNEKEGTVLQTEKGSETQTSE